MMRFGGGFGRGIGQGHNMMNFGFGLASHILGALVLIGLIVLVVIVLIRVLKHKSLFPISQNKAYIGNALEILNERYAKGEIGEEEYQKKKADITKT